MYVAHVQADMAKIYVQRADSCIVTIMAELESYYASAVSFLLLAIHLCFYGKIKFDTQLYSFLRDTKFETPV